MSPQCSPTSFGTSGSPRCPAEPAQEPRGLPDPLGFALELGQPRFVPTMSRRTSRSIARSTRSVASLGRCGHVCHLLGSTAAGALRTLE